MTAALKLTTILNDMCESESHADLWETLFNYMSFCDVGALIYHHLPPPGALDYRERFVVKKQFKATEDNQTDFVDFIFNSQMRKGARVMDSLRYWHYTIAEAETLLMEEEVVSTMVISEDVKGVTFPVHGPGGRNGCFSLVYNETDMARTEQIVRILQWACQNAHQRFCRLYVKDKPSYPKLTERETEILSWVARGKSNSVIAQILDISPHTVNTYMRRLFLKLGTSDRTSLALIGISNNLVEL